MLNRRNFLSLAGQSVILTAVPGVGLFAQDGSYFIRKSSKTAAERARLKRCKANARKLKATEAKIEKLTAERSKVKKKRAKVNHEYRKAQGFADKSLKRLKGLKAALVREKAKLKRSQKSGYNLDSNLINIRGLKQYIKSENQLLAKWAKDESKYGREFDKQKAKEKAIDAELKKQRRLRKNYKKALSKDRCGKAKGKVDKSKGNVSDGAPEIEEFEGGD